MPVLPALTGTFFAFLLLQAGTALAQVACSRQVPAMSFGTVDVLGGLPMDRTLGSIEITCSNAGSGETVLALRTSVSSGASGDDNRRRMTGPGGAVLEYNLFRDLGRTQLWRVGGDPALTLRVPANGQSILLLTVFGRLYGPRDAAVGACQDTLVTTVDF